MKIIKSIVDEKNRLIGFWLEGKEIEFGGFDRQRDVQIPKRLEELLEIGYRNDQIDASKGLIKEQGSFKINELPMTRLLDSGNFIDIENKIMLLTRIVLNGELAGFQVAVGDRKDKYTYTDIIKLTSWFKPANFIVRSVNNKLYIAGKPGVLQLEQLPEEIYGNASEDAKKKGIRAVGKTREEIAAKPIYNEKDILTLYDIIKEFGGVVVKLPNEQYVKTTYSEKQFSSEFKDLHIGEIADPYIQFGEKKLNANTTFKKVGSVMVPVPGSMPFPVYTYTWSTKSIFVNGENYVKRFAIAIPQAGVDRIRQEYEGVFAIKPITDPNFTGPISQLTGKSDLIFFEVDTSKISIVSPAKAPSFILTNQEIRAIVDQLLRAKMHNKFCNGAMNEVESMAGAAGLWVYGDKKPFGLYAGLAPNYLKALKDVGINIFSGAYTKLEEVEHTLKTGEMDAIEIVYGIKGADVDRISYKVLCDAELRKAKANKLIDDTLIKLINEVNAIKDIKEKYQALKKYQDGLNKVIYGCKRKLWLHKMAMFYAGNGKLHTHDRSAWIENTSSRSQANVYECVEYGCDGLYVAIKGMTL